MNRCLLMIATIYSAQASPAKKFEDILKSYVFINDFNLKEETRKNSDEIFWKYNLRFPETVFPIEFDLTDAEKQLPVSPGVGREFEHLNRGRSLYLSGDYEEARKVWLTGRQNFGKNFPFHRRNDYFISLSFLKVAEAKMKKEGLSFTDPKIKTLLANAATFLSWAFVLKKDNVDEALDRITPRALYNLAAIYFNYKRYAGAYGAAESGLNYLRANGRKDYRTHFRRFLIEAFLQQQSYLSALQEIDTAIRQDPDPKMASLLFARAGDIYFALNNYELAEEQYGIANVINQEANRILPEQFVLRGEALFWLGKFEDAIKNFRFALDVAGDISTLRELDDEYTVVSQLRIADSLLALKKFDPAKLEYFRVIDQFRSRPEAQVARLRSACLELPEYDGANTSHARAQLDLLKKEADSLPNDAVELAWACQVASYTQRERTPEMVQRVLEFAGKYPDSAFLDQMIEPIKEVTQQNLDQLLDKKQWYSATNYFEKKRKELYPAVSDERAQKLFTAYIEIQRSPKASEFYEAFKKRKPQDDWDLIREATFLTETKGKKERPNFLKAAAERKWSIPDNTASRHYFERLRNNEDGRWNFPWMLELAQSWRTKEPRIFCSLEYPYMMSVGPKSKEAWITSSVDRELPKLLETDETCALSLLSYEIQALKSKSNTLHQRFDPRRSWPMSKPLVSLIFEVSEILADAKMNKEAQQYWRWIIEKAPKDAPEQKFAQIRLDQSKTEYSQMYQGSQPQ